MEMDLFLCLSLSHYCEVNLFDLELKAVSKAVTVKIDYEAYIEEIKRIRRCVDFYRGFINLLMNKGIAVFGRNTDLQQP